MDVTCFLSNPHSPAKGRDFGTKRIHILVMCYPLLFVFWVFGIYGGITFLLIKTLNLQANLYLYYFEKENLDFIIIYKIFDSARLNEMEVQEMDK